MKDMILSDTTCTKLNAIIAHIFKHKTGLTNTIPNSILYSNTGYGLFHIKDQQLQHHINFWPTNTNAFNLCGLSNRIQTQQIQNHAWSTNPILKHTPNSISNTTP